ncbi:MAG: hypothetical protein ACR2LV_08135 [Solirubrobacteraceae bacterium]
MSTREIRTFNPQTVCDVCGRTLLRGERAVVYANGGARQSVCELCKSRALNEGWVREGTERAVDGGDAFSDRQRSMLSRLRSKRDAGAAPAPAPAPDEDLGERRAPRSLRSLRSLRSSRSSPAASPRATTRESRTSPPAAAPPDNGSRGPREPRHVRAVPTGMEHKVSSSIELFNASEHRRTVAGVARSLGAPTVSLRPSAQRPSVVQVVVSWELCWYRYEVDLSDDRPSVRIEGQGYELEDLASEERQANAVADEHGSLSLPG